MRLVVMMDQNDYRRKLWIQIALIFTVLACLFYFASARAEDWVCKTQATERVGDSFHSCGVANGKDEDEARKNAFDHALKEFRAVCSASDDCVSSHIISAPKRTECLATSGGFRCYRMVVFTLEGARQDGVKGSFAPYYGKSAHTPTARVGMTKADLLIKFGLPQRISQLTDERVGYAYSGDMCVWKTISCWITLESDHVIEVRDFKPQYMDLLN